MARKGRHSCIARTYDKRCPPPELHFPNPEAGYRSLEHADAPAKRLLSVRGGTLRRGIEAWNTVLSRCLTRIDEGRSLPAKTNPVQKRFVPESAGSDLDGNGLRGATYRGRALLTPHVHREMVGLVRRSALGTSKGQTCQLYPHCSSLRDPGRVSGHPRRHPQYCPRKHGHYLYGSAPGCHASREGRRSARRPN